MALVFAFLIGLESFSDMGVAPSIIRSPDGDRPEFLNTAWTLQSTRGIVLWLVSCAIAWPAAWVYGQPELAHLLPVMGLTAALNGFNSTSLPRLNRVMAFRTITMIDLGTQAVSLVVMVGFALVYRSVWALVAGTLASSITRLIASHLIAGKHRDRFQWDKRSAKELIGFGRWIFMSTLLTFLVSNSDRFVFGKIGAMAWLGTYSIALTLATMPSVVILKIGGSVTFPAYSRIFERGGDLAGAFRRSRLPLLMCGGMMVTGLIVAGPSAVAMLYDQRYHEAGVILQLLAAGVWFQVLECTNGALMLAVGDAGQLAVANAAKLVVILVGMIVGYHLGGIHGAILALVAGDVARYALTAWSIGRRGMGSVGMDLLLTALVAVGVFGSIELLRLLPAHLPAERFTRFLVSTMPPLAIWSVPMAVVGWDYWTKRRAAQAVAAELTAQPA
jgi:O-antigen/teichoic acid export membrane protein